MIIKERKMRKGKRNGERDRGGKISVHDDKENDLDGEDEKETGGKKY